MRISKTEKEFLESYNIHDFDIPLTSVDMAIFTVQAEQLKVLLVKRAQFPAKGKWALPGGFINLTEDKNLDDTAARKLKEKTGVETSHLEQVITLGSAKRDPRGWSVTIAYMALIASENIHLMNDASAEDIQWISVSDVLSNKLSNSKLAFDHLQILELCYERLKNKVLYTSIAVNLLDESFTLPDLQKIFEIILGTPIEKKSFRRRLLDAEILEETGEMKLGSNRPAKLYKAKSIGKEHYFSRNIEGPR